MSKYHSDENLRNIFKSTFKILDKSASDECIHLAVERGDHRSLQAILSVRPRPVLPKYLLGILLRNYRRTATDGCDYRLCLRTAFKDSNILSSQINEHVSSLQSERPIHYAVRYAAPEIVLQLLRQGASLADSTRAGLLPLAEMDRQTIESHLDACISLEPGKPDIMTGSTLCLDFSTLLPNPTGDTKIEKPKPIKGKVCDIEMDASVSLCQSNIPRTSRNRNYVSELAVPLFMSRFKDNQNLLVHPLIAMFVFLKWSQYKWVHTLNLTLYLIFYACLNFHILLKYVNPSYSDYSSWVKSFQIVTYIVSWIGVVLLCFREIFQIVNERKKYFYWSHLIENAIEWTVIITTFLVLSQYTDNIIVRKQIAAITILASGLAMFLLIGKHPRFAMNVVILKTVTSNVSKLLLWYAVLLLSFGLSFYTLFGMTNQYDKIKHGSIDSSSKNDSHDISVKDEEANLFLRPELAALKTIVMLTGEFDASAIDYDRIPVVSIIIFILFVFIITIVLFNLVNGLAVSDTQYIKAKAEIISLIEQVQYIDLIERNVNAVFPLIGRFSKILRNQQIFAHGTTLKMENIGNSRGYICDDCETIEMKKHVRVRRSIAKVAQRIVDARYNK